MKTLSQHRSMCCLLLLSLITLTASSPNFASPTFSTLKNNNLKIRREIMRLKRQKRNILKHKHHHQHKKKHHRKLSKKKHSKQKKLQKILQQGTNPFYFGAVNPQFTRFNNMRGPMPFNSQNTQQYGRPNSYNRQNGTGKQGQAKASSAQSKQTILRICQRLLYLDLLIQNNMSLLLLKILQHNYCR